MPKRIPPHPDVIVGKRPTRPARAKPDTSPPRIAIPDRLPPRKPGDPVKSGPEQLQLRYREIQERLLLRGQHPTKVCREMSELYGVTEEGVATWIKAARLRWRELTSQDELHDRQEQLEAMAHNLYEMALGDKTWQGLDGLLEELEAAAKGTDKAALQAVVDKLLEMRVAARPNLKVAATLIANLGRFYGLGTTLKLDIPGLTFSTKDDATKPAEG